MFSRYFAVSENQLQSQPVLKTTNLLIQLASLWALEGELPKKRCGMTLIEEYQEHISTTLKLSKIGGRWDDSIIDGIYLDSINLPEVQLGHFLGDVLRTDLSLGLG